MIKPDVMALAADERRKDAKRVREQARHIGEPVVRHHLLDMASLLDEQARMLEPDRQDVDIRIKCSDRSDRNEPYGVRSNEWISGYIAALQDTSAEHCQGPTIGTITARVMV